MERLAEMLQHLVPELPATLEPVHVERMTVSLPVELYVRGRGEGSQILETSAPCQSFVTSVMPVLHRLELRIVADGAPDETSGTAPR